MPNDTSKEPGFKYFDITEGVGYFVFWKGFMEKITLKPSIWVNHEIKLSQLKVQLGLRTVYKWQLIWNLNVKFECNVQNTWWQSCLCQQIGKFRCKMFFLHQRQATAIPVQNREHLNVQKPEKNVEFCCFWLSIWNIFRCRWSSSRSCSYKWWTSWLCRTITWGNGAKSNVWHSFLLWCAEFYWAC